MLAPEGEKPKKLCKMAEKNRGGRENIWCDAKKCAGALALEEKNRYNTTNTEITNAMTGNSSCKALPQRAARCWEAAQAQSELTSERSAERIARVGWNGFLPIQRSCVAGRKALDAVRGGCLARKRSGTAEMR